MKNNILPALRMSLVLILVLAVAYPALMWGIAQLSPNQGKGEIVTYQGKKYYSNVGQKFDNDNYFWSRPSAVDYNAAGSGASNKGATNPEYLKEVEARIQHFQKHNPGIAKQDIPMDMITASGSGLDPHISVKAAEVQAKRIASLRQLSETKVLDLIKTETEKPALGLFGPEKINVLKINIALDQLH
ncbi:K(+)-transporting ATPase subunit C [Chryseobacterium sp. TY4]